MFHQTPFVTFVMAVFGLVLLTMFITWVAYGTVQMLQRRDARNLAKVARLTGKSLL